MGSIAECDSELEGTWDSHVHVCDEEKFPLHPLHPYRPKKADLDDLLRFESQLGISHVCLIAFSVYHTDNSSIVDALTKLGGKGRAVVCIDPEAVTDGELRKLHGLGARGVRLNLKTRDQRLGKIEFEGLLKSYADKIRCLGWALQLFVAMEQIDLIADVLPTLGIPVVIDHLGAPHPSKGAPKTQPGYEAGLIRSPGSRNTSWMSCVSLPTGLSGQVTGHIAEAPKPTRVETAMRSKSTGR